MTDETTDGNTPRDSVAADGGAESYSTMDDGVGDSNPFRDESAGELMPEDKREFLLEAIRRAPLLEYLGCGSANAGEILEGVDMSRSTVHRALDSLSEFDIVQEAGGEYELTEMGRIIVEEMDRFGTRVWTASSLTQFLNSIEMEGTEIPIEYLSDATVTRREPRQPHATIHRIMELFEKANELRMLSTVISPIYVDIGYKQMMNGMAIDAIFEREVVDLMLSEYPEKAYETMAIGNFDIYAHDDIPFELFIFEDRIGMAAHNVQGNAEILIESDDPTVVSWAEDLYERHHTEATSLSISDI